ncbi:MAG: PQQ-binding-like beta-propeller repeat protein [Candidatus Firestonebacteria bacterium]
MIVKGAVVVKRKLIPGLLLLIFIFCSYFSSEEYIPSSFVHQPAFFEADTVLLDFDNKLKDNDSEGAVRTLQEGIDRSPFLVIKKNNYEFVPACLFLTEKLFRAGDNIIKTYRMLFDSRAEELYNKAIASADKAALKELLLIYGASSFAEKARETLSDYYLSEGNYTDAYLSFGLLKDKTVLGMFKTAICLEKLERKQEALGLYKEIIEKYPETVIEIGGKSGRAGCIASEKVKNVETAETLPEFPFKSGEVSMKWKGVKLSDNPFERSEPVLLGDKVYVLTENIIYALNKEWGEPEWKLDLGYKLNAAFYPAVCGPGLAVNSVLLAAGYSLPGVAYGVIDPKKGEILGSSLKGEQLSSEKMKFTASFNLPAVEGADVYLGLISKKDSFSQYCLVKTEKGRKNLKWTVNMGGGSQEQYMFVNAPAPIISGDELFVETNLFTIASVDKYSGNINWIYGCPPDAEKISENMLFERSPPYKNMLIDSRAVYYAPRYKKVLIAVSRMTGEKLWEAGRSSYETLICGSGDFIYTADTCKINRISITDGKKTTLLKTEGTGRSGKVTFRNGWFYFPANAGFCLADLSGKDIRQFRLDYKVTGIFPAEDGVLLVYNGELVFFQDKEYCLFASSKAAAADPDFAAAAVCRARAEYKDGEYLESIDKFTGLLRTLPEGDKKEKIKTSFEEIALRAARSFYNKGDFINCKNILEKFFWKEKRVFEQKPEQTEVAWLLMNCYEKTKDVKLAEYCSKTMEDLKGAYFKPEQNLKIAADYYMRVKKEDLKEYFSEKILVSGRNSGVNVPPVWKASVRNSSNAYVPILIDNRIYFANEAGVSIFDPGTGKPVKENLLFKNRLARVDYGGYGVFPKAIAGGRFEVYFCGPDFNIYGLDTKALSFNFEWKPAKRITPTFLPYKIDVTDNLLVVFNPNEGVFALSRSDGKMVYEIAGEFHMPVFFGAAVYAVEKNTMILCCFDAATGIKRWNADLQSGIRNLEMMHDNAFLYIITEEGVIYKIRPENGLVLMTNRFGGNKAAWDFYPSGMSESNIYLNTGRNLICVDKAALEKKWIRDTYVTYKTEVKKGAGKGAFAAAKVNKVVKSPEMQRNISWIYSLGNKLLVNSGEFLEVYDAGTSKAELWGDKALRLASYDRNWPVSCFLYEDKTILVKGQFLTCFSGAVKKK